MIGTMLTLAIITIPAAVALGIKAFFVVLPVAVILIISAMRIEKIKKEHQLQTYQEILAFVENRELSNLPDQRNHSKNIFMKLAVVCLIITLFMALLLTVGYFFINWTKK